METNLSHFLAQAREDDVTERICWHLPDMLFRVPLLALEGVGPRGLLQVLLTWVAALAHHLPAKAGGHQGQLVPAPLLGRDKGGPGES